MEIESDWMAEAAEVCDDDACKSRDAVAVLR